MKRQIRRGVFETNSSSTHSLTICLKSDYDRWTNGEVYLYKGSGWGYPDNSKPKKNGFYTKEECIAFLQSSKYPPEEDMEWNNEEVANEYFRDNDFYESDYNDDNLEWFEDTFETPSGERVVAFGEYGYDG